MQFYCYKCDSFPLLECGASVRVSGNIHIYVCEDCAAALIPTISDWRFRYDMKPILDKNHDWEAVHKNYDGPPDTRSFTGPDIWDLFEQIEGFNDEDAD